MDASNDTPLKRCSKCKQEKHATTELFHPGKYGDGLKTICRECVSQANKEYYEAHKEEILAKKAQDRLDRPDFYAELNRNHKEDPIEKAARAKRYREENPDKVKAQVNGWRERNPDHIKSYSVEYYVNNKDEILVRKRSTYKKKPAVYILISKKNKATRRARKRQAGGTFSKSDLIKMYDDQDGRCMYCGISIYWSILKDVHLDHILPLSRGGSNSPDNLALTCADCNLTKRNYLLADWQATRGW